MIVSCLHLAAIQWYSYCIARCITRWVEGGAVPQGRSEVLSVEGGGVEALIVHTRPSEGELLKEFPPSFPHFHQICCISELTLRVNKCQERTNSFSVTRNRSFLDSLCGGKSRKSPSGEVPGRWPPEPSRAWVTTWRPLGRGSSCVR